MAGRDFGMTAGLEDRKTAMYTELASMGKEPRQSRTMHYLAELHDKNNSVSGLLYSLADKLTPILIPVPQECSNDSISQGAPDLPGLPASIRIAVESLTKIEKHIIWLLESVDLP